MFFGGVEFSHTLPPPEDILYSSPTYFCLHRDDASDKQSSKTVADSSSTSPVLCLKGENGVFDRRTAQASDGANEVSHSNCSRRKGRQRHTLDYLGVLVEDRYGYNMQPPTITPLNVFLYSESTKILVLLMVFIPRYLLLSCVIFP